MVWSFNWNINERNYFLEDTDNSLVWPQLLSMTCWLTSIQTVLFTVFPKNNLPLPRLTRLEAQHSKTYSSGRVHKHIKLYNLYISILRYGDKHNLNFAMPEKSWMFPYKESFNASMVTKLPWARLGYDMFIFHRSSKSSSNYTFLSTFSFQVFGVTMSSIRFYQTPSTWRFWEIQWLVMRATMSTWVLRGYLSKYEITTKTELFSLYHSEWI